MKKLKLLLILFLGIFMLSGCQKWGEPEFIAEDWIAPPDSGARQFWIKSLIDRHVNGTAPDSLVRYNERFLRYIRAVVVSSDEGGNYYKSMVIQDSTGGVELQLDRSGLYNLYPVGQKIVIVCKPVGCKTLMIGDYNHLPQIGWVYQETSVGRINSLYFDKYIIRDGLPSLKNLPKPLTNDEIDFTNDVNKLVRLENVTFNANALGKPISYNDFTTEWKINVPLADKTTKEVTVRTSNYAKFRSTIIEDKKYNLTGILTVYRAVPQLMIRTKDDIEVSNLYDFITNPMGEDKWSIQSLLGTTRWSFRDASMTHFGHEMISYNTSMDDWFISPMITISDVQNAYMRFEHQLSVLNDNYDAYQIYYTTTDATTFNIDDWKLLGKVESAPTPFGWSAKYSLSKIGANNFRIAFRYYAPDKNVKVYRWSLRKVEIRNY